MKNGSFLIFFLTVLLAFQGFSAEEEGGDSKWRFSVGPAVGGNLKSSLGIRSGRLSRALDLAPYPAYGVSREEARRAGDRIGAGRVDVSDDGRFYIDPEDYAGIDGESVNWRLPSDSFNGHSFSIENPYHETSYSSSTSPLRDRDERGDVGLSLSLDREIWTDGRFGVDFGLMFTWLRKDDAFKANGTVATATATSESGRYVTDIGVDEEVASDPWFANADGTYGGGSYYGPGPVLSLGNNISHSWVTDSASSRSASLYARSNGDYDEQELALLLRPWFDVTEWFRLVGTLGVGLSRAAFDFSIDGYTGGRSVYHDSQKFDSWDVYGIAGLGGMFSYDAYCLGVDFMAKFLDDDLDIDGRSVEGKISRESWTCRVYIGYEF